LATLKAVFPACKLEKRTKEYRTLTKKSSWQMSLWLNDKEREERTKEKLKAKRIYFYQIFITRPVACLLPPSKKDEALPIPFRLSMYLAFDLLVCARF